MFRQKINKLNRGWQNYNAKKDVGLLTLYDLQSINASPEDQDKEKECIGDKHDNVILKSSAKFHRQTTELPQKKIKKEIEDQVLFFQRPKFMIASIKNKVKLKYSIKRLEQSSNLQQKYQELQGRQLEKDANQLFKNAKMPKIKLMKSKQILDKISKGHFQDFRTQKKFNRSKGKGFLNTTNKRSNKFLTLNSQQSLQTFHLTESQNYSSHLPLNNSKQQQDRKLNVYNFCDISFDQSEKYNSIQKHYQAQMEKTHPKISYKKLSKEKKELNPSKKKLQKPLRGIKLKLNKTNKYASKMFAYSSAFSAFKEPGEYNMNSDRRLKQVLHAYFNHPNKRSIKNLIIYDELKTI